MSARSFARKCGKCRNDAVQIASVHYETLVEQNGREHRVVLPDFVVPRCGACGAIVLDGVANLQISRAVRQAAGLLTPEQISENRLRLGLARQEMADCLGVPTAVLARWETGVQLQPRALDRFLRAFFALPQLRTRLAENALSVADVEGSRADCPH